MVEIIYPATGVHVFTRDELLETYLKRGFVLADETPKKAPSKRKTATKSEE